LKKILILLLSLVVLLVSILACAEATSNLKSKSNVVDPIFSLFYEKNGGEYVMGPVRSALFEKEGWKCQSTTRRIMCFDPSAPEGKQYFLRLSDWSQDYTSPFSAVLDRMGGVKVFGLPIEEPVIQGDTILQTYQTVVVYAPSDNPKKIHFKPKARDWGQFTSPVERKKYGRAENMVFYPVQGEYGYHVPVFFDGFIAAHGGMEFSGKPISKVIPSTIGDQKVARQCFDNYCLDYLQGLPPEKAVRLAPVAELAVMNARHKSPAHDNDFTLHVNVANPWIRSNQPQIIQYQVVNANDPQAVANLPVRVVLTLPNGITITYDAPPTDDAGFGSVLVPPNPEIKHSMQIVYKVCLVSQLASKVCGSDFYLIWDY